MSIHKKLPLVADALSIIGFVILFVILLWGAFHIASLTHSWVSSLFPQAKKTISLTAPAEMISGQSATLSWAYAPSATGTYALLYQCTPDVALAVPASASASSSFTTIPCGSAWGLGAATSSITVMPTLQATSSATSTISIVFIPSDGGAQAHADARVAIVHAASGSAAASAKESGTGSQDTGASRTSAARAGTGTADLSVHVVAVGVIDPVSGMFVSRAVNSPDDIAAVQFSIENIGSATSGTYTFTANLPTEQSYPYYSAVQSPLSPGSHMLNTLRFSDVAPGGGMFGVVVVPQGADASAGNDTASAVVSATYYSSYNPYQYQYQNVGPYYQPAYMY